MEKRKRTQQKRCRAVFFQLNRHISPASTRHINTCDILWGRLQTSEDVRTVRVKKYSPVCQHKKVLCYNRHRASRAILIGGVQVLGGVQTAIKLAAAARSHSGVLMSSEWIINKSIMCWSSDIKTDCNALDSEAQRDKWLFPQSAQNPSSWCMLPVPFHIQMRKTLERTESGQLWKEEPIQEI